MSKTGSSPWASDLARPDARFVVVGNSGTRRVELFQAALAALGQPAARLVAWADLLAGRADLASIVRRGDVVRLESPGKDFEVERAILALGADQQDEEDSTGRVYHRIDRAAAETLEFDKGRILWPRQWYLGFRAALRLIAGQLQGCPPHRLINGVDDVAVMFDKRQCHGRLAAAGVSVPRCIGPVSGFDELTVRMAETGTQRVFVKLAHGSSASGVVAYQTAGSGRQRAITTVEMVRQEGELRLYNSRRLRTYELPREIAGLINALARHRVHVEQWLPKAGIDGRVFDLRVLVVASRAGHTVARLSRSPMTNLHLLNDRRDGSIIQRRMREDAWAAAMAECEGAMTCFPGSLHGGVDLLIATGFRRHAVLEVNAFGDLLPGVLWQGMDTYEAQVAAVLGSGGVAAAQREEVTCP